jgi:hypothetical protein
MGCTDQFDIASQDDPIASFIEMRRVAGGAGSVIVHDGYLWEPGRPDVHFGAPCAKTPSSCALIPTDLR